MGTLPNHIRVGDLKFRVHLRSFDPDGSGGTLWMAFTYVVDIDGKLEPRESTSFGADDSGGPIEGVGTDQRQAMYALERELWHRLNYRGTKSSIDAD
jgi:hypothetical protein